MPSRSPVVHKYWCWRARYCRGGRLRVCARDRRLAETRQFPNECAVFKYNCDLYYDFTVTRGGIDACPKQWKY